MLLRIPLLLVLTTTFALAETEETIVENLDVTSGGNLVVDVGFGTVDIAPGTGDKKSRGLPGAAALDARWSLA